MNFKKQTVPGCESYIHSQTRIVTCRLIFGYNFIIKSKLFLLDIGIMTVIMTG